jgi:hypothetical protein
VAFIGEALMLSLPRSHKQYHSTTIHFHKTPQQQSLNEI